MDVVLERPEIKKHLRNPEVPFDLIFE